MQATEDIMQERTDGSALQPSDIGENFVSFLREEGLSRHGNVAFIADESQVSEGKTSGNERYVVLVLPDIDSSTVLNRKAKIHAEIRRTWSGHPIACVMFAERMVEVAAMIVSEAFPLAHGRLNILWIFRDGVALDSHDYTEDMEQDFSNASMVAEAHQHERDPYEGPHQRTPVEVHTGWMLDEIRPPH